MPDSDPGDRFFYLPLTPVIDPYIPHASVVSSVTFDWPLFVPHIYSLFFFIFFFLFFFFFFFFVPRNIVPYGCGISLRKHAYSNILKISQQKLIKFLILLVFRLKT